MFAFNADDINEVLIGTVIQYKSLEGEEQIFEKLYIHRFTMGEKPEPRARWVAIYTKVRTLES